MGNGFRLTNVSAPHSVEFMRGIHSKEAPKVYVETSVLGMTLRSQPHALREPTKHFLHQCQSGVFIAYISTVVLQEIVRAGAEEATQMLAQINRLVPIELFPNSATESLAEE